MILFNNDRMISERLTGERTHREMNAHSQRIRISIDRYYLVSENDKHEEGSIVTQLVSDTRSVLLQQVKRDVCWRYHQRFVHFVIPFDSRIERIIPFNIHFELNATVSFLPLRQIGRRRQRFIQVC